MKNKSGKALYLLLTSIVGILLFVLLQRAALTIWVILSSYSMAGLSGKVSDAALQMIDGYSMLIALFVGAWYGIWVGLNWHQELYGDDRAPRMLHRFLPHSMRPSVYSDALTNLSVSEQTAEAVPVVRKAKPRIIKTKSTIKSTVVEPKEVIAWSFEDLAAEKAQKKVAPKRTRAQRPKKLAPAVMSEPGSVTVVES